MTKTKPKLIIWDYDGVLSDSEKLWIKIWQDLINEKFGLGWDFETADKILGGLAVKTKIANLKEIGIELDNDFWEEVKRREKIEIEHNLTATPDVEEILKETQIPYCLATGGLLSKTEAKLKAMNFKKYFPDSRIFTAEQVERGKARLFDVCAVLFRERQMNAAPAECLVIEDSLPGLKAAIAAGMTPIAFIGSEMNNTGEYRSKVEKLGVKLIFSTMKQLREYLSNIDK